MIHRGVRMLEDGFCVLAVLGEGRDADAWYREEFGRLVADRGAEHCMTGTRNLQAKAGRAIAHDDHELIATEARQNDMIMRSLMDGDRLCQLLSDDAQHVIAHGVTEGVVDALEAVQIQIDERHALARRSSSRD